jgi:pilus assembly protein Flp/PilA
MTRWTASFLGGWPRCWRDERGATAIEYALIAASIAAAIAATVFNLGSSVRDMYTQVQGIFS